MFTTTLKRAIPALVVAGSIVIGITGISAADPQTDRQVDPAAPTLPADTAPTKLDPAPDTAPTDSDEQPTPDVTPTPGPAEPDPDAPDPEAATAADPAVLTEDAPTAIAQLEAGDYRNEVRWSVDSVVASAEVFLDSGARRVTVRWGDGQSDTRRPQRPTLGSPATTLDFVRFTHAYPAPADGSAFPATPSVTVVNTDGSINVYRMLLRLTPRYRVTMYTSKFRPLSHCDGPGHATSEFEITQHAFDPDTGAAVRASEDWRLVINTRYLDERYYPLLGSMISAEMTMNESVAVTYFVWESDFVGGHLFDLISIDLNPQVGSGRELRRLDSGCRVEFMIAYETQLLHPGIGGTSPGSFIATD